MWQKCTKMWQKSNKRPQSDRKKIIIFSKANMWQKSNKKPSKCDKKLTRSKKVFKMWQKSFQKCGKKLTKKSPSVTFVSHFCFKKCFLTGKHYRIKSNKNVTIVTFLSHFVQIRNILRPSINHQRPTKAASNCKNVTKMWQKQQKTPLCRQSSSQATWYD